MCDNTRQTSWPSHVGAEQADETSDGHVSEHCDVRCDERLTVKRERNKPRAFSDGPKFFLVLVSEGISRTCAAGVCCSTAGHFVVCRQHNPFPFCTSQQSTGHHAATLSTAQLYRRTSGHRLGNVRAVTDLIRPVPLTAPCPQPGSSDSSLIQSRHYGHNRNI
jgi:hypothetical protein